MQVVILRVGNHLSGLEKYTFGIKYGLFLPVTLRRVQTEMEEEEGFSDLQQQILSSCVLLLEDLK